MLISHYLDDQLTPDQLQQLSEQLAADPVARDRFTSTVLTDVRIEQLFQRAGMEVAAEHLLASLQISSEAWEAAIQQTSGCPIPFQVDLAVPPDRRPVASGLRIALAASIVFILAAVPLIATWKGTTSTPPQTIVTSPVVAPNITPVAKIGRVHFPETSDGNRLVEGTSFTSGESVHFGDGLVEIRVLAGADVILKGPAHLEFISPLQAVLHRGTLTAKVEDRAHGFRVDTPNAKVIDLGTEFGVSITEFGETDVVVFAGSVEMHASDPAMERLDSYATTSGGPTRLMQSGDGLRVRAGGGISRLVSINSDEFPTSLNSETESDAPKLITHVSDNLRENDTTKCYRIVANGFSEDAIAYVDRDHQWNGIDAKGIPSFLVGADYVMPFNDDKMVDRLEVEVAVSQPARIYVIIDNRVPTPEWLSQRFVNTGHKVGLDEGDFPNVKKRIRDGAGESIDNVCSIWVAEVDGGETLVLGSLGVSEEYTSMYGIAATPLFPVGL
jgi:hypothetical protein